MPTTAPSQAKGTQVRVKPVTLEKLRRIAASRRWKINEAVDAITDEYAAREGIELPESKSSEPSAA